MRNRRGHGGGSAGFSLIEMMIVVGIIGLVLGGVFSQINASMQRAATEQVKVDDFDEARDFVDQFFRDINQIGYPNIRMVDTTSPLFVPPLVVPFANDARFATGLVRIDNFELRFEGDTNADGIPETLIYKINGSGTCALCLQRSQINKVNGDPLNGQPAPNWGTEVNDADLTNPIFTYYRTDGTQVLPASLPLDTSTVGGQQTLASIKTIQINLRISNPNVLDPKTHQAIQTTYQGEVSLNNCSMAANGMPMSCQ
ncbi:MAG TPA: type II secretion system protein [Terriglobales bacterium]|nr:type II secretion system protein [Terriglobales bacterium]